MSNKLQTDFVTDLNVAQIVASINIVTIKCCCPNKSILMGQMGLPIECPICKRIWFVSATAQIKIQEVLADLTKDSKLLV